jgi:myo-inositol-1(or 4)-monophosphatase
MKATRYRNLGTTALHLAYVAKGSMIGMAASLTKLWDIAAGAFIIETAGGIVTDMQGNNIFPVDIEAYNEENYCVLATNKKTHSDVLKLFMSNSAS